MGLMHVSRRVDYGLRAVIYLSSQDSGKSCCLAEIAEQQKIPRKFLEKIIQDLTRGGLVKSKRGPDGGYALARAPGEISFQDVIETLDGPIAVNVCMDGHSRCDHLPRCTMRGVWDEVQRRIMEVLTRTTLSDLARPSCQTRLPSSSLSSAA
ncbi:MAG: Rrf2 family transcriptional regulator [Deltaproteobacteria bacterium]|nr:Rrf2 family transcriptional regulator [Deltaproteobacteria bacterium]